MPLNGRLRAEAFGATAPAVRQMFRPQHFAGLVWVAGSRIVDCAGRGGMDEAEMPLTPPAATIGAAQTCVADCLAALGPNDLLGAGTGVVDFLGGD